MYVRIILPIEDITIDTGVQIEGFTVFPGKGFHELANFKTQKLFRFFGDYLHFTLEPKYILYYEGEISEHPRFGNSEDLNKVLESLTDYFISFFNLLWLQKDNSVHSSRMYIEYIDYLEDSIFYLRDMLYTISDKSCMCKTVKFTKEEINEAIATYDKFFPLLNPDINDKFAAPTFDNGVQPQASALMIYTFSRIVRAYDFLDFARNQFDSIVKITFYVACYECLFTSGNSEMTHQVSERASLYIGGTREEKQDNYDLLKQAYSIRSRYIHGDTIKKSREDLLKILDPLDELTRKVFNKVLNEPDIFLLKPNAKGITPEYDQYFKDLIFS